jgi:uncharacterized protein YbjT (DUF2867 family)
MRAQRRSTLTKVFQIGAAGGVGRRLSQLLVDRGDQVTGMHRRPDQAATISSTGATPVVGDLIADTVDELVTKLTGHDAVVFSAGAHGTGMDQTSFIDGDGLRKAADAAAKAGVGTFVLVSVFPDALRAAGLGEAFEHYIQVKKNADIYLTNTKLDWVIVRPGTLRDEPGDGLVTAGPAVAYGEVRRDNVAAFIDAALHEPTYRHVIVEVIDGDTPVVAAVTRSAETGDDTSGPRN